MVVHHRPYSGALTGADVAAIPVGKALVRDAQGVCDTLWPTQLGGKKVEGFSVRHGLDTKRSVEFVNGVFRCDATQIPLLPLPW